MKLRTILYGVVASVPVVLVAIGAEPLVEYLWRQHLAVAVSTLGAVMILVGLAGIAVATIDPDPDVVDDEPDAIDLELFALLDAEAIHPRGVRILVEPAPWEVRR